MDIQQAKSARLDAQMRAADARLDQMEAQARAQDARDQMDEISGLRARRDQVRQQVAAVKADVRAERETIREGAVEAWNVFRRSLNDSYSKFVAWDAARERRLAARIDQAEAALRESSAEDAVVAADVRIEVAEAKRELLAKAAQARRRFDAWREKGRDERARLELEDAELELDEASNRYAAALETVRSR